MIEELVASLILKKDLSFFGMFLSNIKISFSDRIDTACVALVGNRIEMWLNREFFEGLNENDKRFVFLHEIFHICEGHLFLNEIYTDKKVANVATDIWINQNIPYYKIPEVVACTWDAPGLKDIPGMKKGLSAYEYYQILINYKESLPEPEFGRVQLRFLD